jgi:hypothetical protein
MKHGYNTEAEGYSQKNEQEETEGTEEGKTVIASLFPLFSPVLVFFLRVSSVAAISDFGFTHEAPRATF